MFNSTNGMPFTMNVEPSGTSSNGFGGSWGDGAWWIIILLIFCFGGWGNGFGNNGSSSAGAYDNYVLASDFATLQRQIDTAADGLRQQSTQIANGISSLGYDQLGQMNGINTNINSATNTIVSAINSDTVANMQNTNSIGSQITALGTQMASCCCDNRYQSATQYSDLNYKLAEQSCQTRQAVADSTATVVANQDANTRSILSAIQDMQTQALQDKIAELTAANSDLRFQASQSAQNAYLVSALSSQYGCNCGSV